MSLLLVGVQPAIGADGTWTAASGGSWNSSGNWSGAIPGLTTGTTSTDTATFNGTGVLVTVDANRNLKNILFDTNAGSFTLNGGPLLLTSGGTLQIASGLTGSSITETISAPITIEGSYTFANNNSDSSNVLNIGSITNAAAAVVTLAGNNTGANLISGAITPTTGTLSLVKNGTGLWSLGATNTYTGATTINAGTLALTGLTASIANSAVTVNSAGTLSIDSGAGTPTGSVTRASSLLLGGGTVLVAGTGAGSTNDVVTGALTLNAQTTGTITLTPNAGTATVLTFGSLTRAAGNGSTPTPPGGFALINGTNLGSTASSNASRVMFTTAPSFVGSSVDGGAGSGSTKNLGIIPYLLGEVSSTPGGGGTATGTANTFLTYNATTGLRPLDLTNEYVNNPATAAAAAGNNIRLTSATSISGTSINSLVISGGNLTISSGTMSVASGAILFTSSGTIGSNNLALAGGVNNGTIYVNAGGITPTISSAIKLTTASGDATLNVGAGSTLTLTGGMQNTNASNAGYLNIIGGGTVVLNGNAYTPGNTNGSTIAVQGAGTVLNVIGSSTVANIKFDVGSGAIVDTNTTGSLGSSIVGFAGNGTIKLTSQTPTVAFGASLSSSNLITGGKGLTIGNGANTGTYTISGTYGYSGGTTIQTAGSGVVTISMGAANVFSNTGNFTIGNAVFLLAGNSQTIGTLSGTGGNIDNSSATGATLTVNTAIGGSGTYNGIIKNTGGASSLGFTKKGINTETLTGLSTYGGATTVNNGSLLLDLSTNTTGVLSSNSALVLGGGVLNVQGKATGSSSQTLGNLTLSANTGSGIVVNNNGGTSTTLTVGNTWNRGAGSTVNINLASGGALASSPASLTNGVLGYATVTDSTGTGFATVSGGNIVRYTGATIGLPVSGAVSTTNYSTSGTVAITASQAVNSLAIDTSTSAGSLDMGGSGNVLSLTSGGLLMTGANNYVIQNGQIGANNSEVIVQQYGTGTMTIAGVISGGTGSLTKAGNGTLIVTGANSYTGATNINGGVLNFSTLNNLGNGGAINFGGGTLQYANGNTADITSRAVSVAGAGGTIDTNGNNVTFANGIGGAGGLTKTGNGTLTLSGNSTYSGDTAVNGGTLQLDLSTNSAGVINSNSALLLGGGTLAVKGKSTGNSGQTLNGLAALSGGSTVSVNNNGGSGVTLTINGLWTRSAGATVNFDLSSSANNVLQTQTVSNTNGIVGGWLTITDATGTGFATYADVAANVTNPIVRYTGASTLAVGSNSGTANFTTSGTITLNVATHAMNSLAIDTSATAGSMNLSGASFSLASGGLLMTGGNDYSINNGQVGANNAEVIVHQYGTGVLTIAGSVSGGTGSLTKAGPGTLALTGTSTYTGATTINSGVLQVDGALSASSPVTVNGGTLSGTGTVGATTLTGNSGMSSAGQLTVASLAANGAGNAISSGTVLATAGTTVNSGGTLNVNGTLGGGAVNVNGTLGGTGKVTSAVTVSAGGSTNPGAGLTPGVLTLDLAYNANSVANFNISGANPNNGSPQAHLSGLYYSQIAVTVGAADHASMVVGAGTVGGDSTTSQVETAAQIQGDGTSNSGVALKLSLSASDFNTLKSNAGQYQGFETNSNLDNYFVFTLGQGLATGRFSTLDFNIDGVDYTGTIYYAGANDRFSPYGIGNWLGDVVVDGQEFAVSYAGNAATNSTTGGNDIVLTAIPEPGTLGMILAGFGMLMGIQRLRRRRVGI